MILNTTPVVQPVVTPIVQPIVPPIVQPLSLSQQQWRKKYPSIISGILAFLEFGFTVVIIGLEIGSILIDMVTATIYVGLWAGLFFTAAWISLSGSSCCCRDRGCATYTLITQIIALFFAACVIGFDTYYIINPSTCFFPSSTCNSKGTSRGLFYSESNFNNIKMSLIKAQLAAGAVMLILCLIYIIIYVVTSIRVHQSRTPQSSIYPQSSYQLPTGPDGMMIAPSTMSVRAPRTGSPLYHRPTMVIDGGDGRTNDLLCPTCSTMMNVTVKKRPPQ